MANATVRQEKPFGSDHGVIHEAVVTGRKVGADEAFWAELAHNKALFRDVVALVNGQGITNDLNTATVSPEVAMAIMGENYHHVARWASECKFWPTKADFSRVPFSADLLTQCKNTHILVPILPLSIMQLHVRFRLLFSQDETEPWFAYDGFASEQAEACWVLVRREVVPDSTSKSYIEQEYTLPEGECVPSAAELCQALICHAVLTDERLLPAISARTTSFDLSGDRIILGNFGLIGLTVECSNEVPYSIIGVAGARKSNSNL